MNTDTPETNEACGYASNWDRLNNRLRDEVPAEFARKLERERDDARRHAESYEAMLNIERQNAKELLEELKQWKNSLSILGDTPEKVWDAWRKQVIKTQKYIREMVVWRDKAKTVNQYSSPTASVKDVKDIFNSF